jgi:L,D-transpeptidase YcbB
MVHQVDVRSHMQDGSPGPVRRSVLRLAGSLVLVAAVTACSSDREADAAREHIADVARSGDMDSVLVALYAEETFAPRWYSGSGITREGRRALEALAVAEQHGLGPAGYDEARAAFAALDSATGESSGALMAEAELALSRAYAALANDIARGRLDPGNVQHAWKIPVTDTGERAIVAAWGGGDPVEALEMVEPLLPQYRALIDLRDRLKEIEAAGGWPAIPENAKADRADRGPAVAALRTRLGASDVERERTAAARGTADSSLFDEGLAEAVRSFQTRHGLHATGAMNEATREALNVPVGERIRTVEINLERWRWMPRDPGAQAILVNIPAYTVYAVEDARIAFSMNTVVGRPDWPTTIFHDTMTHLIVNPYWNVPESILQDEILPRVQSDMNYLERNGYEVVDADGNVVGSDGFEFARLSDPEAGWRIRQTPGSDNALGRIKFMFPNPDDIYLHDTPAKHLFSEPMRARSHGCIRLEDPIRFARYITRTATDEQMSAIEEALQETQPRQIDLSSPIPVYLAYLTAWVEEDGSPRFLPDVYGLDQELIAGQALQQLALRSVGEPDDG